MPLSMYAVHRVGIGEVDQSGRHRPVSSRIEAMHEFLGAGGSHAKGRSGVLIAAFFVTP